MTKTDFMDISFCPMLSRTGCFSYVRGLKLSTEFNDFAVYQIVAMTLLKTVSAMALLLYWDH